MDTNQDSDLKRNNVVIRPVISALGDQKFKMAHPPPQSVIKPARDTKDPVQKKETQKEGRKEQREEKDCYKSTIREPLCLPS